MKQIKNMLIEHLNEHPLNFGNYDIDTVLDFLYTAYCDTHDNDTPKLRSLFAQLSDHLESLPREKNDAMFSIIVQLHTELTQPEVQ